MAFINCSKHKARNEYHCINKLTESTSFLTRVINNKYECSSSYTVEQIYMFNRLRIGHRLALISIATFIGMVAIAGTGLKNLHDNLVLESV